MISLAYEVLINPQKRARYDIIYRKQRKVGNNGNGDGRRRAIHAPDILHFHNDTILADYFGIGQRENFLNRGMDLCYYLQIESSFAEMGGNEPIYYSRLLFCERCSGIGMVAHDGKGNCEECDGEGFKEERRKLVVQIPPGISDGTRLYYRFLGDQNFFGMPPGDLVIVIQVC
jgi:molecular chaperone DnaJ